LERTRYQGKEIKLEIVNASVVVLPEGNNPRLLNPDFLERNRIVPTEWKIYDVVVTPPFAQVNGRNTNLVCGFGFEMVI
jgi:hypothetical protein